MVRVAHHVFHEANHPTGPDPAERLAGQGLDEQQYESGDRAIHAILTDATAGPQTDLVITYRDGAYEVWAARGMIRFERLFAAVPDEDVIIVGARA